MTDGDICPHCGESRLIEPVREGWLCSVCGKTFKALPPSSPPCLPSS